MVNVRSILPCRRPLGPCLLAGLLISAAAAPLRAQDLPCGSPHVVASGDTLSGLARRAYGDADRYQSIIDANRDVLGTDPTNLAVGTSLDIPCESAATPSTAMQAAIAAEGTLSAEELDTLFGPVALFPDPLLTPTLVATTFPLDVVKAARFVEENGDVPDKERVDKAANEPWDDSVRQLAAGFPEVVTRMSDNIDWTEQAGEAVVGQTDDVLASIQRLRGTAEKNGYLKDSEAQNVETVNDKIQIAPAESGVVYVPTYDSQVVYTTPVTAGQPAYHYGYNYGYDDGTQWDDVLVTGGILLGGAVILDEIFDDDDWDGWDVDDDIDWDRGDITIDRGDRNIDRDRNIERGDINIDRDNVNIDRDRISGGERVSIGSADRPQVDRAAIRDAGGERAANRPNQRPVSDANSRAAAKKKIEARKASGAKPASLKATKPKAGQAVAKRKATPAANRPSAGTRPAAQRAAPRAEVSRPKTQKIPKARAAPSRSNSAFQRPSGPRASAASQRGRSSMGHAPRGGGGRGGRR